MDGIWKNGWETKTMTIEKFEDSDNFVNITLDKTALLHAYIELDKIFNKDLKYIHEINRAYELIEKATGFSFKRTLVKKPEKELSKIKT